MVLKAIKKILGKNCQEKHFFGNFPKFGNFLKFLSLDIFRRSCEKQCFLHLEHIWSISHLHPMQRLLRHNNCCYITKYHSIPVTGILLITLVIIYHYCNIKCGKEAWRLQIYVEEEKYGSKWYCMPSISIREIKIWNKYWHIYCKWQPYEGMKRI